MIPPPLPLITPYDDPNTKITANELNNERVQNFFTRLQNNEALVREVFALVEHNAASLETGIAEAEGGWAFLESQFAVSYALRFSSLKRCGIVANPSIPVVSTTDALS